MFVLAYLLIFFSSLSRDLRKSNKLWWAKDYEACTRTVRFY